MNIISITSLNLPQLEPYRTLRRPLEHRRNGIFVAEGEKVVHRLLESKLTVLSVLMTPEWLEVYRTRLERRIPDAYVAPKRLVETIVGFPLHQGIMAVGRVPESQTLEALLPELPRPAFLAALDGLTNAENIGVLVRNCAAFGVQAILVGETSSSPYLRRAVRNSMGAVFQIPVVHVASLSDAITEMRENCSIRTVAAHPGSTSTLKNSGLLGGNCCVVFGSEGDGISNQVLNACDEALSIPMSNGVDSLNVGSASAVFLYEILRRRGRA